MKLSQQLLQDKGVLVEDLRWIYQLDASGLASSYPVIAAIEGGQVSLG